MVQILKSKLFYFGAGLSVLLLMGAGTGVIRWDQINHLQRNGTDAFGQSSDGTHVPGNIPTYDSLGGLTQTYGAQGSDSNLLTAGTVSGTGSALCTDANGGATTVACSGGGGGGVVPFAFASIPACSSTAAFYQLINTGLGYTSAYCDGSSTLHFYADGSELFQPIPGSFTNANFGSCTDTTTSGGMYISCPSMSGVGLMYQSYPAGAFTRTIKVQAPLLFSFQGVGLGVSDGTKIRFIMLQYNGGDLLTVNSNNTLSTSCCTSATTIVNPGLTAIQKGMWLQYSDDGTTNRTWAYSLDGVHFQPALVESRTTFVTGTEIGMVINPQSAAATGWFLSWQ